ncbi:MAG: sulfide-dependent adenosine diphosphate thiazole synthase [Phycisphaerae bacterium]|nr:sulfide-dependent adenosine diphosphate thiazole synthase [Phycisphaerae bacterium]
MDQTRISQIILDGYHAKLGERIVSDAIIVGAGPAGLLCGYLLAKRGVKVTLLEKRLTAGGGIWGGGMGMNEVVIQDEAVALLDDVGVRHRDRGDGLHSADSVELAAALTAAAVQAGCAVLNLMTVEDLSVRAGRVTGVVANRTMISGALHVDPIMFSAGAVLDGTGHEAICVQALRRRGLLAGTPAGAGVEGPMDPDAGEAFVVENAGSVYPGLYVAGMSVSAALGGPRMGPIFGGMLLSGRTIAEQIADDLSKQA